MEATIEHVNALECAAQANGEDLASLTRYQWAVYLEVSWQEITGLRNYDCDLGTKILDLVCA